jgi:hydroxyacylglutathione hydrolase
MPLEIESFVIGPLQNNTYLVADDQNGTAVVIDPSFDSEAVIELARERKWQIKEIWLTHAHFDHFAGAGVVAAAYQPALPVRLHGDDLGLWRSGGNARNFGFEFDPGPEPSLLFTHGQKLSIGDETVEVRHAPGHTRGHVMIYCPSAKALLCGDVIFQGSIGRTDLPGGNYETLLNSIRSQVLTLPDDTRLLSGHGPESTVGEEREENPYLA